MISLEEMNKIKMGYGFHGQSMNDVNIQKLFQKNQFNINFVFEIKGIKTC